MHGDIGISWNNILEPLDPRFEGLSLITKVPYMVSLAECSFSPSLNLLLDSVCASLCLLLLFQLLATSHSYFLTLGLLSWEYMTREEMKHAVCTQHFSSFN
jgi:hypothetical protein